MYLIKALPGDFQVVEKPLVDLSGGNYAYYELRKSGLTTAEAIARAASVLHLDSRVFNIAGNKDRRAETTQVISVHTQSGRDLSGDGFSLRYLGQGSERQRLGNLRGNEFIIIVRHLSQEPIIHAAVPNYYDDQRFGVNKNNHIVGKLLVEHRFKEAAAILGYFGEMPVEFLARLDRRISSLYIHSFQSKLFNELVAQKVRALGPIDEQPYAAGSLVFPRDNISLPGTVPTPGFGADDPETIAILKAEGLTPRDFVIRQLPALSSESMERQAFIEPEDLNISAPEPDDLNPGFQKRTVRFSLPKGSYGTMVIRSLFRKEAM